LRAPVVTNVEAAPNNDAGRVRELLVAQVSAPVRWDESVQKMTELGVERFIEIGPGKVLAGLIKRIAKGAAAQSVEDVRRPQGTLREARMEILHAEWIKLPLSPELPAESGAAIALTLAAEGARIVASARNGAELEKLVAEIKGLGGEATAVAGDVSVSADADRLVESAVAAYGRLDILVNNAGITRDGLLLRMKDEDWDAVLNVNLKGAFLCSRAAAKVMSKQRYGRIVNISSVVGEMGNAGQANYCASKAGLLG
jgi:hypothetical protein